MELSFKAFVFKMLATLKNAHESSFTETCFIKYLDAMRTMFLNFILIRYLNFSSTQAKLKNAKMLAKHFN